uniref:Acrosin n=1 Tax=Astyanax mexicanus TaxID=7994 RepID=A0A3B1K5K4_ASTMX
MLLLLMLLLLAVCCGERPVVGPPGGSRIVGGRFAPEGAWPWQVSIQWMFRHLCGGSIISQHWIISAAHCFNKKIKIFEVTLVFNYSFHASWHVLLHKSYTLLLDNFMPLIQKYKQGVIVYEDYDQTLHANDVALLRLFSPLFFSSHVQPVCTLTNQAEERELGFNCCFISGWGSTIYKGRLVDTLREAEVELIDTETCNQRDWYRGSVTSSMLCAGLEHGGVDTCQGDSGGPLSCYSEVTGRFYLYGVTSQGENCGLPRKPGLYTRASSYSAWIRRTQEPSFTSLYISLSSFYLAVPHSTSLYLTLSFFHLAISHSKLFLPCCTSLYLTLSSFYLARSHSKLFLPCCTSLYLAISHSKLLLPCCTSLYLTLSSFYLAIYLSKLLLPR